MRPSKNPPSQRSQVSQLECDNVTDVTAPHLVTVESLKNDCRDFDIVWAVSGTITEGDLARLIGLEEKTLKNWRYEHCPIPYRKIGGRVRYALADVAAWLNDQR